MIVRIFWGAKVRKKNEWGRPSENLIREANNRIEHFSFALYR